MWRWFLSLFRDEVPDAPRVSLSVHPFPTPLPPPQPQDNIRQRLLLTHNNIRRAASRTPLALEGHLNLAAYLHAAWMAANRNMSHEEAPGTPLFDAVTFSKRVILTGYPLYEGGENIAAGYPTSETVSMAWDRSPGHHANIVNPRYTDVGFAVASDAHGHLYWCAVFGASLGHVTEREAKIHKVHAMRVLVSLPPALVTNDYPPRQGERA